MCLIYSNISVLKDSYTGDNPTMHSQKSETYLELPQTTKMESFETIVDD